MTSGAGPLAVFDLSSERDVFALRRSGRNAAEALGLERQDQVRLATALSEVGRDRLGCDGLTATFTLRADAPRALVVTFEWTGGTAPTPEALALAARLVHSARYESGEGRGRITVEQPSPVRGASASTDRAVRDALRLHTSSTLADDLRAQTRDLIATLDETRAQREELRRLNEELEETNRGVLALYTELSKELEETNSGVLALHTELDEKSRQLRAISEAKTRFWTTISHELRTPVNAVVALSRLLTAPGSSPLDDEQRRQISLITFSGHTLLALVNDLLDVAKAESGQLAVVWAEVDLRIVVGQLTGVLRSTYPSQDVVLVTPDPKTLPVVVTDEVLLTRILRNLLSNALKFTEKGEVRLELAQDAAEGRSRTTFTISDTGVGIPEDELSRVFEEFYQVPGLHQRGYQGSGLGLPYARTLTELLGGSLTLTSTPGTGTYIRVILPDRPVTAAAPDRSNAADAPDMEEREVGL
ncbi:sensor histidine kinase [Streptomyces sp. NPDC001820]|uniref:sensor histidine kinase n=1 Tax=Streptomyces sp. NPDC001820 TaxID=3364613 RepID=UPI0036CA685D